MADFADQLEGLLQQYGGLVNLTVEERKEVTQAGAEVDAEYVRRATKEAGHYNPNRKIGELKHLADSVEVGKLEGTKLDGSSATGFSKEDANHARIARMLNDGTRYIKGDSFIDNAHEKAKDAVFEAEAKVLRQIQEKKMR